MLLFHGTNQHFEAFLDKEVVRATHGASADTGVFLTTHAGVAEGYARHAHSRLYPGDHAATERRIADLYEKARLAERRCDFVLAETLITEADAFEQEQKTTQEGMRVLTVEAVINNPKVVPDAGRINLHDMRALVLEAFSSGHDSVVFENIWDPVDLTEISERYDHVVVSDPRSLRIVEFREISPQDEEPDLPSP